MVERLAARHEDADVRAVVQQPADDFAGGVEDVLAVVEDEEPLLAACAPHQGRDVRRLPQAQRAAHLVADLLELLERLQIDEVRTQPHRAGDPAGRLQSEQRLAAAPRSHQGHEPVRVQTSQDIAQVLLAPQHAFPGGRQAGVLLLVLLVGGGRSLGGDAGRPVAVGRAHETEERGGQEDEGQHGAERPRDDQRWDLEAEEAGEAAAHRQEREDDGAGSPQGVPVQPIPPLRPFDRDLPPGHLSLTAPPRVMREMSSTRAFGRRSCVSSPLVSLSTSVSCV